ncbi:MAG: FRG domain-containing protein [Eubacteriaceae bacterium]|nr:FRG domain-containing protein [Eubacteriaceae bacterium]
MTILQLDAYDLQSFYIAVQAGIEHINPESNDPIWFRGQEVWNYKLLPSLLRTPPSYNHEEAHLAEEIGTQQFAARAYHVIDSKPNTNIEWQEIMQHYEVATRLLDWSENVNVALMFALLPFISDISDDRYKFKRLKKTISPTIWLLNPCKLNETVFEYMNSTSTVFFDALSEFGEVDLKKQQLLIQRLSSTDGKNKYLSLQKNRISSIVSLSMLENLRSTAADRLYDLLNIDEFNLFYYLILRVYSDGIKLSSPMPPIAMMHPYHSNRIAMQHGVFTIFPFPDTQARVKALDDFSDCHEALCKIRLVNPKEIARQMKNVGNERSNIYPDLFEYAKSVDLKLRDD